MQYRSAMAALALLAALCAAPVETLAWNETSYPDFKGQWRAIGDPGASTRAKIGVPHNRRR